MSGRAASGLERPPGLFRCFRYCVRSTDPSNAMKPAHPATPRSARGTAALAIAAAAMDFPDVDPQSLNMAGLDDRDARLAQAIHRAVLQRWITLEHLLNYHLRRPLRTLEPNLQGVLLTGAAQLLVMDRLPVHAVVDESVKLARKLVRSGAAGMVNAVLRRVSELIVATLPDKPWSPAADRIPLEAGYVKLGEACLPAVPNCFRSGASNDRSGALDDAVGGAVSGAVSDQDAALLMKHLSIATSHPLKLVRRWSEHFGLEQTQAMCVHDLCAPPVIVAADQAMVPASAAGLASVNVPGPAPQAGEATSGDVQTDEAKAVSVADSASLLTPHAQAGHSIWAGTHAQLTQFLKQNPGSRVQDPTAALAVESTSSLAAEATRSPGVGATAPVRVIIDYCAGRGTKTRQLAALHPTARIIATDTDTGRLAILRDVFRGSEQVRIVEPPDVARAAGAADLILLDVPCSNTGVLARRPEARYRFNDATRQSLVKLQREIAQAALSMLAPGGFILYSTCSVEEEENQQQARWLCDRMHGTIVTETLTLPAGVGPSYHDGGYFALIRQGV